jgi:glycosyltransferase involved in cell wall biosynthesis
MKLLFVQEYHLNAKGGGAYIYKRLLSFAKKFNTDIAIAYDATAFGSDQTSQYPSYSFRTLFRKYPFGVGRIIGILTIFGLDFKARFQLRKIIRKEKPDFIHLTAHGAAFPLTYIEAVRCKKPYLLAVHDLWPGTVSGYIPKWIADRLFRPMVLNAHKVYVISDNMGKFLCENYGIDKYIVIHDGVNALMPEGSNSRKQSNSINLMYAGILHNMQSDMLNSIVRNLANLKNSNFEIHVCSTDAYKPLSNSYNVKIVNHGWVDETQLRVISGYCDFGLLPLSFAQSDELFYRTSLMTKIPFYLGAGLPILCFGPAGSSAVEIIKNDKIGLTIEDNLDASIQSAFEQIALMTDKEREDYLQNIRMSIDKRFNSKKISNDFFNSLS